MLEVTHISKYFGGVKAVRDISFSIAPGNILACIGPNAAGKTTLLNIISGWHRPDKGSVKINGKEIESFTPEVFASHGVVRTFQRARLFRNQSVIENLIFASRHRSEETLRAAMLRTKWLRRQDQESDRAQTILSDLGISELCHKPGQSLSGGEQRLVELAVAAMRRPQVLVLDEPTANLSKESKEKIGTCLLRQKHTGLSCILVDHDLEFVQDIADQILILSHGMMIGIERPSTYSTPSLLRDAYSAGSTVKATMRKDAPPSGGGSTVNTMPKSDRTPRGYFRQLLQASLRRRGRGKVQLPVHGLDEEVVYEGLAVRSLSVDYGNGPVIEGVTLDVNPGEIIALVGSNGAGKSTIMRAILGLVQYQGSIKLGSKSLAAMSPFAISRLGISYVAQNRKVFPTLTVLENLLIAHETCGNTGADPLESVLQIFPELTDSLSVSAGALSGGQQQMVALGRALLQAPRILLLDEPSAGLSESLFNRLGELLLVLSGKGLPILIVEHRKLFLRDAIARTYLVKRGTASILKNDSTHHVDESTSQGVLNARTYQSERIW